MSLERELYPRGCKILFPEGNTCVLMCGCRVAFGGEILDKKEMPDGSIDCITIPDSAKGVIYQTCAGHEWKDSNCPT